MTIDVMSNATQLRAELERLARRAFMPSVYVQIWKSVVPFEYSNPTPYEIERWADDGGRA